MSDDVATPRELESVTPECLRAEIARLQRALAATDEGLKKLCKWAEREGDRLDDDEHFPRNPGGYILDPASGAREDALMEVRDEIREHGLWRE